VGRAGLANAIAAFQDGSAERKACPEGAQADSLAQVIPAQHSTNERIVRNSRMTAK